jgi:hypothetical protein
MPPEKEKQLIECIRWIEAEAGSRKEFQRLVQLSRRSPSRPRKRGASLRLMRLDYELLKNALGLHDTADGLITVHRAIVLAISMYRPKFVKEYAESVRQRLLGRLAAAASEWSGKNLDEWVLRDTAKILQERRKSEGHSGKEPPSQRNL